jgi:hypothetical protein
MVTSAGFTFGETEQISGVVLEKVTGCPDAPPVALTVTGGWPNVLFASAPNVICWSAL